jgi:hypothetical protein
MWLVALIFIVLLTAVFLWGYRQRLDALTGPWITETTSSNSDQTRGLLGSTHSRDVG